MPDDPSALLTTVELTWIEKQVERWLRFGRPVTDMILDRQRRVLSFVPGSVFAFVRWAANDYGTIASHIDIVRTVRPGEDYQKRLCRSGARMENFASWAAASTPNNQRGMMWGRVLSIGRDGNAAPVEMNTKEICVRKRLSSVVPPCHWPREWSPSA